jgi:hypothetical protein
MALIEQLWLTRARLQASCDAAVSAVSGRLAGQSTVEYALVGEITNVFSRITSTLSGAAPSGH